MLTMVQHAEFVASQSQLPSHDTVTAGLSADSLVTFTLSLQLSERFPDQSWFWGVLRP